MMNFEINHKGRDFFVGDLHGCVDQLQHQMITEIDFDYEVDRMFSVGDLIDRGPHSLKTLNLLSKSWFHAVVGNHEALMLNPGQYQLWMYNGGDWWNELTEIEQRAARKLAIQRLHQKMTVNTEWGRIGVIHADVFGHWDYWQDQKEEHGEPAAIWGRKRWYAKDTTPVTGIEAVVVGHTPVEEVTAFGNVLYIDTGAVFPDGHLTILEAKEVFDVLRN
jgi:serine/threonine protein phosphatase 1